MKVVGAGGRFCVLWLVMGLSYALLEFLYRGYTYPCMIAVGGLCGALVGALDQSAFFRGRRIWLQCLVGTAITVAIEFGSGCLVNLRFGVGAWDYRGVPCNLLGQICLRAAVCWFLLMPFVIFYDDWLRWLLFGQPRPERSLLQCYRDFFLAR